MVFCRATGHSGVDKYRTWGITLQSSHSFVAANVLMGLAKTYDQEASRGDMEAGTRRRLAST